MPACTAP